MEQAIFSDLQIGDIFTFQTVTNFIRNEYETLTYKKTGRLSGISGHHKHIFYSDEKVGIPTIHEQLLAAVLPTMTGYQTDLTEHDKREIEANAGKPFIHVAREMSTHLFIEPDREWLVNDIEQPYLFGRLTPQKIVQGNLGLITDYFGNDDLWHYFDGKTLRAIDQSKAIEVFSSFIK